MQPIKVSGKAQDVWDLIKQLSLAEVYPVLYLSWDLYQVDSKLIERN